MNLDLKILSKKLKPWVRKAKDYTTFIFIIGVLILYGFLVFQISRLSQADPKQSAIDQQLAAAKRLKIDQDSINKIQQLKDQNINVQSLFESARDNPFQD